MHRKDGHALVAMLSLWGWSCVGLEVTDNRVEQNSELDPETSETGTEGPTSQGENEGISVSDDRALAGLTRDEAVAFCEETNTLLGDGEPSVLVFNCYFMAFQESLGEPTLDCEALAANCITDPPPGLISPPRDCDDPEFATQLGINCTSDVGTVRTCFRTLVGEIERLSDGLTCMNFGDRVNGAEQDPPTCMSLDDECPDFRP